MYDPIKKKAAQKRWYESHKNDALFREVRSMYRARYYIEHRDEELSKRKEYERKYPERKREWNRKSRERRKHDREAERLSEEL